MMLILKIFIQFLTIYRAGAAFIFMLFYTVIPNELNTFLLITAFLSDLLDGYLAKKYGFSTIGGKLLDLFGDKYLNCILIIFLIVEKYTLLPLLVVLTKEIFVLSFRSIEIDGNFVISTNRIIGGIMSSMIGGIAILHINGIFLSLISTMVTILGIANLVYLIYKIVTNFPNLKKVFKN